MKVMDMIIDTSARFHTARGKAPDFVCIPPDSVPRLRIELSDVPIPPPGDDESFGLEILRGSVSVFGCTITIGPKYGAGTWFTSA